MSQISQQGPNNPGYHKWILCRHWTSKVRTLLYGGHVFPPTLTISLTKSISHPLQPPGVSMSAPFRFAISLLRSRLAVARITFYFPNRT